MVGPEVLDVKVFGNIDQTVKMIGVWMRKYDGIDGFDFFAP